MELNQLPNIYISSYISKSDYRNENSGMDQGISLNVSFNLFSGGKDYHSFKKLQKQEKALSLNLKDEDDQKRRSTWNP